MICLLPVSVANLRVSGGFMGGKNNTRHYKVSHGHWTKIKTLCSTLTGTPITISLTHVVKIPED